MPLPPDIQVITEGDVTRVILPQRVRTAPRWVGLFPILFGLIFASVAFVWMSEAAGCENRAPEAPIQRLPPGPLLPETQTQPAPIAIEPEAPDVPEEFRPAPAQPRGIVDIIFGIVFMLFTLPFLAVGLMAIGAGILMFFPSHSEIMLSGGTLWSIEHAGPFRYRWKRPIAQVTGLRLGNVFESSKGKTTGHYQSLFADTDNPAKPMRLAPRYPKPTLLALGEFLQEQLKRHGRESLLISGIAGTTDTTQPITLTVEPDPPPPIPTPAEQAEEPAWPRPETSKIEILESPDVLTFMVPRSGFRGGAGFLLIFGAIWGGITIPMFIGMTVQLIREPSLENLGIVGFLSIFAAIGAGFLLGSIQLAFRKSVILATRDSLVFTQTGPVRNSEHQWPAEKLAAIRYGNSNTTVNGRVLQELQIETQDSGTKRGLLVGWPEEDLRWLSSTLRRFYRLHP